MTLVGFIRWGLGMCVQNVMEIHPTVEFGVWTKASGQTDTVIPKALLLV